MKSNGYDKAPDDGLQAVRAAFHDAKFFNSLAKEAAGLITLGAHREYNIPDSLMMEVYGMITEGHNAELTFTSNEGNGFIANIESYADLISFLKGNLQCQMVKA